MSKRFGAAVARWAHNPKVRGSKPRIAIILFFFCLARNACAAIKKKLDVRHSALTVPEWSPTSVLGKPNDA